jgi:hypothetical protein
VDAGWPGTMHVRSAFWAFLVGAVLLSLVIPAQHVWQAASSALQLRTCVWPTNPQVGQTVRLFVVPRTEDDHRAVAGPWTTFVVTRGMTEMAMDTPPVVRGGQVTDRAALALPLRMDMAGIWWIHLTVQARGRPTWQTNVPLTVLSPGISPRTEPQAPSPTGTEDGCHIPDGSQQL